MKFDDKEVESLRRMWVLEGPRIPEYINSLKYKRNKVRVGSVLVSLARIEYLRALCCYYVDGNIAGFKLGCYRSVMLTLHSIGEDGGEKFGTFSPLLLALLSDNEELVQKIALVRSSSTPNLLTEIGSNASSVIMFTTAMTGDDDVLSEYISSIKGALKKRNRKIPIELDFYANLLNRDEQGLLTIIQEKHSRILSADPLVENFWAPLAMMETKLCWRRGLRIEISSPWVPMEMMPLDPLANYSHDYDFIESNWIAPKQGYLADLHRWIKSKFS